MCYAVILIFHSSRLRLSTHLAPPEQWPDSQISPGNTELAHHAVIVEPNCCCKTTSLHFPIQVELYMHVIQQVWKKLTQCISGFYRKAY